VKGKAAALRDELNKTSAEAAARYFVFGPKVDPWFSRYGRLLTSEKEALLLQHKLLLARELRRALEAGDVLRQLADLARVPEARRDSFSGLIVALAYEVWGNPATRVKLCPSTIAEALVTVRSDRENWDGHVNPRPSRTGGRGKPKGAIKDPPFQIFVREILQAAEFAGGRLTLQRNAGRGSLIGALKMLDPYLPGGFMPPALPLSTIERIMTRVRAEPANLRK
jgi:hypothetical protein